MQYSGYVGRVGGLAVALGVGTAVVMGSACGTATADTPGASSSVNTDSKPPPNIKRWTQKRLASGAGPASRLRSALRDGLDSVSGGVDGRPATPDGRNALLAQPTPGRRLTHLAQPRETGRRPAVALVDDNVATGTVQALRRTVTANATAVGAPAGVLSTVVGTLLQPVTKGTVPGAPPESPALWVMLAAARRQFDGSIAAFSVTSAPTPLGTEDQLAAEQVATRVIRTVPVQVMKIVLDVGFVVAAYPNFALVGGPNLQNLLELGDAVDEYTRQAAMEQQLLDSMNPKVLQMVMPPHSWDGGQTVGGTRILYDNPDTVYRMMAVNNTSTYVITGQLPPGTNALPADTNFSVLTGLGGDTADNITLDDIDVDSDGKFTIVADSTPTAPGQRNHLYLPPEATLIVARNTLSDWDAQQPMALSIERVDGPPDSLFSQFGGFAFPGLGPAVSKNEKLTNLVSIIPPLASPPPVLLGAEAAVIMALGLGMEYKYMAVATMDPETRWFKKPNEFTDPSSNAEFLATQVQSAGYFQLKDDEALVLTIDPGDAQYFVVPVTNDWTITDDYWDQQTSLNNAQAKPNADGTYTIVVSKNDPGVANWVSTGGLNQGTISIRFQDLGDDPTDLPKVSSQVVKLNELDAVLPVSDGTAPVTPEQREIDIAERNAAYYKRYGPFAEV